MTKLTLYHCDGCGYSSEMAENFTTLTVIPTYREGETGASVRHLCNVGVDHCYGKLHLLLKEEKE